MTKIFWNGIRESVARADAQIADGATPRTIDKIGFLVHRQAAVLHYRSIWRHLPPDLFDVVLFEDGVEPDLFERLAEDGYSVTFGQDVINGLERYAVGVSHSDLSPVCKPQGYSLIADLARLLSYGFSKQRRCPFNDAASLFLSQGPEQQAQYQADYPDTPHLLAGYPRLDGLQAAIADRQGVARKYRLDPARPTLVWMPTHSGPKTGGITLYADAARHLARRVNLLLKPHPESFQEPPDCHYLRALVEDGAVRVVRDPDDEAEMFAIADIVVTDLGGTLFGAIYACRDVVIADVGRRDEMAPLEEEIWPQTPILSPTDFQRLEGLLTTPQAFQAQRELAAAMRRRLFADGTEGRGGEIIARELTKRLDERCRHGG